MSQLIKVDGPIDLGKENGDMESNESSVDVCSSESDSERNEGDNNSSKS